MRKKHKYGLPLVAAFLLQASSFAQTTPLINLVEIPAGSFYMGSEGKGEDYDFNRLFKSLYGRYHRAGFSQYRENQRGKKQNDELWRKGVKRRHRRCAFGR